MARSFWTAQSPVESCFQARDHLSSLTAVRFEEASDPAPHRYEETRFRLFAGIIVVMLSSVFCGTSRVNLILGPLLGPLHLAALDPVVRLAGQLPTPDRRCQRCLAVALLERPLCWAERRHHLI